MVLRKRNLLGVGCIALGKLAYDEYNGNSLFNIGLSMLERQLGEDFTVLAGGKSVPSFPLPENAEYAGDLACEKPEKRRRLYVAHLYGGSTKQTIDSHRQHLCKFKIDPNADFVYCPAVCYLEYVKETYPSCVDVGVQNIYPRDSGNFTGETSLPMVKELGATYVLIGTTHRRVYLGETEKFLRAKIRKALNNDMKCIIFLSNTTGGCDTCSTEASIEKQVESLVSAIDVDEWDRVALACETPRCPADEQNTETFDEITRTQQMCKMVREKISDRVGNDIAERLRILYSGDMCHGSAPMFMTQKDIDGAVFSPSNDSECFINIINSGLLVDKREENLEKQQC